MQHFAQTFWKAGVRIRLTWDRSHSKPTTIRHQPTPTPVTIVSEGTDVVHIVRIPDSLSSGTSAWCLGARCSLVNEQVLHFKQPSLPPPQYSIFEQKQTPQQPKNEPFCPNARCCWMWGSYSTHCAVPNPRCSTCYHSLGHRCCWRFAATFDS